MATLLDVCRQEYDNAELRNRLGIAIAVTSLEVLDEKEATSTRRDWAHAALMDSMARGTQWMRAVCCNPEIQAAEFKPSDELLLKVVRELRDKHAV
jgi:hypothetical protein